MRFISTTLMIFDLLCGLLFGMLGAYALSIICFPLIAALRSMIYASGTKLTGVKFTNFILEEGIIGALIFVLGLIVGVTAYIFLLLPASIRADSSLKIAYGSENDIFATYALLIVVSIIYASIYVLVSLVAGKISYKK